LADLPSFALDGEVPAANCECLSTYNPSCCCLSIHTTSEMESGFGRLRQRDGATDNTLGTHPTNANALAIDHHACASKLC
jgi:hypothetical protein